MLVLPKIRSLVIAILPSLGLVGGIVAPAHAQADVPVVAPMATPHIAPQMVTLPTSTEEGADLVKSKVTFTYNHSCDAYNGHLYVNISKKAPKNTMLCSGKFSANGRYDIPMYVRFIVVKHSGKGSSARVNILLQTSPKASKRWKHTTLTLKPIMVGYKRPGKASVLSHSTYHWFNNVAASYLKLWGEFQVKSTDNKSGMSFVSYERLVMPTYFDSKK